MGLAKVENLSRFVKVLDTANLLTVRDSVYIVVPNKFVLSPLRTEWSEQVRRIAATKYCYHVAYAQ